MELEAHGVHYGISVFLLNQLNLSNGESVEIWFDEYNDCYTWSNASYGYEDTYAVVQNICEWLEDNLLEVINIETV